MYLKNNRGVTLSALAITVIVMLIISSTIIYNTRSKVTESKLNKLYQDLENINGKIDDYYLNYGEIPTLTKFSDKDTLKSVLSRNASSHSATLNPTEINPNDGDEYYVIDLEKLDGLVLNYGYGDDYNKVKNNPNSITTEIDEIYIINKVTHQVYYPSGIFVDGYMYYSYNLDNNKISVTYKWRYKEDEEGRKTIVTNGEMELPIGTYINYNAAAKDADEETTVEKTVTSEAGSPITTEIDEFYSAQEEIVSKGNGYSNQTFSNKAETNGWRVLGVDEVTGEIMIISAEPVKTIEDEDFTLQGIAGYQYGPDELNKVCGVFGEGYGATEARSITVEDINKITGYNPNNTGVYDPENKETGVKYGANTMYEYGNQVTYMWNATANKIDSVGSNGQTYRGAYNYYGFNWYDIGTKGWKTSKQIVGNIQEIVTLTGSYYLYYSYSLTNSSSTTGEKKGISKDSNEYKTLFMDILEKENIDYWMSTPCVRNNNSIADFDMFYVNSNGGVTGYNLYNSRGYADTDYSLGVRPVVNLKSDIQLEWDADNNCYDIVE